MVNSIKYEVDELQKIVEQLLAKLNAGHPRPSVLVLGDSPWDEFWICKQAYQYQAHSQLEYPQFRILRSSNNPGAVFASVALLLGFGFHVTVLTGIGKDERAKKILQQYKDRRAKVIPVNIGCQTPHHYFIIKDNIPSLVETDPFNKQLRYIVESRINDELNVEQMINDELNVKKNQGEKYGFDDNTDWRNALHKALDESEYMLISDIHRGTLSWATPSGCAVSEVINSLKSKIRTIKKPKKSPFTLLDVRRRLEHYSDISIDILTSSAYETAEALDHKWDRQIDNIGMYQLKFGEIQRLIEDYPNIENFALTCAAAGFQQGIRQGDGSVVVRNISSYIKPNEAWGVTPHSGDVFNVGVLIGHWVTNDIEKSALFAQLLASIQVQSGGLRLVEFGEYQSVFEEFVKRRTGDSMFTVGSTKPERYLDSYGKMIEGVLAYINKCNSIILNQNEAGYSFPCFERGFLAKTIPESVKEIREKERQMIIIMGKSGTGKTELAQGLVTKFAMVSGGNVKTISKHVSDKAIIQSNKIIKNEHLNERALLRFISKVSLPGLVIDEFPSSNKIASDLLQFLNKKPLETKILIIVGSALQQVNWDKSPWRDLSRRSQLIEIKPLKERIEDFPFYFGKMKDWFLVKDLDELKMEIGALQELMVRWPEICDSPIMGSNDYDVLKSLWNILWETCSQEGCLTLEKTRAALDKMIGPDHRPTRASTYGQKIITIC